MCFLLLFFFNQKTAYEMRISDWSSDVCSSDLDAYALPTLDLLAPAPKSGTMKIDAAGLEQNARLLESVLEDFGVKGEIVEVRPGPVVTMYELEPAAGIKASRVIGLADDIARSMSAISARVAERQRVV